MNPEISVVIPTRNESETLEAALASLEENSTAREVIIVDAASTDGTADLAEKLGATVVRDAPESRAAQMNIGARETSAGALLFLHADTRISPGALDLVIRTLSNSPTVTGGGFLRKFDSPSSVLRATARLAGIRSRVFGLFFGDQGIFARRDAFEEINGFDESLALCEDLDFSRRLRRLGRTVALGPPVLSSARRFEARGPVRTTLGDVMHAWRYFRQHRRC